MTPETPADDDDWLNLDQPLPAAGPPQQEPASVPKPVVKAPHAANVPPAAIVPPAATVPAVPASPPAAKTPATPAADDLFADDFPLSEPASDLPAPAANGSGGAFDDGDWSALQGAMPEGAEFDPFGASTTSNADPLAAEMLGEDDVVTDFRVTCPICASITYARPNQVGKQIKCSDCYSKFVVPPPPKPKKVYKPDIENAEVFQVSDSGASGKDYTSPFHKSARELLQEAEDAGFEEEESYENPDVKNWFLSVFRIFLDVQVPVHWMFLSLVGTMIGLIAWAFRDAMFLLPMSFGVLTLFFWAFVCACGFSVMESVSNNAKKVAAWPYMDPAEWFGQMVTVWAAAGMCIGPVLILSILTIGLHPLTVLFGMFALFIFFPFVLMSMLDSESIFIPFSLEVTKSVTRCQEQWGVLYLTSGLLFTGLFFMYLVCFFLPGWMAVGLVNFITVGGLFAYFAMLGRLAYAIGYVVPSHEKSPQ
ncbi:hypothetical protein FF011L_02110 [Roseimaritima multifibrata]|uniref:Uncharacterized protein n=1 Tax=Roseimaritima multifibrata TaxID=1930274 RepID=A0A517M9H3_9BACT|nr:hypothetical protein FF011L_02110 [Roseimaritima multifibrata]